MAVERMAGTAWQALAALACHCNCCCCSTQPVLLLLPLLLPFGAGGCVAALHSQGPWTVRVYTEYQIDARRGGSSPRQLWGPADNNTVIMQVGGC